MSAHDTLLCKRIDKKCYQLLCKNELSLFCRSTEVDNFFVSLKQTCKTYSPSAYRLVINFTNLLVQSTNAPVVILCHSSVSPQTTGNRTNLALGRIGKKIARFKRLENSRLQFQNDLAFLGRIGKPSLSEFPEIYGFTNKNMLYFTSMQSRKCAQLLRYLIYSVCQQDQSKSTGAKAILLTQKLQ